MAPWDWLASHYARGVVVVCRGGLDLIDVGVALAEDDSATVAAWMATGDLYRPTDDDAAAWVTEKPTFEVIVVAPFVVGRILG